ncbi:hypothetical protein CEP54_013784 [Fusarium duplospermum]|uniref:Uncharacterized protein n=1 Tax=Fusarium duplospermum TaxID=1325734 RepID=A0A428P0M3_9HYPO|nr:hypothetical protein CEP54_013784 [Fusarium duplospermum]
MAPTSSDEFEGDDFSNNLFSDLAPLLTLFGEQVTRQFLSMSMGWADNVLLAMGPLGIITIIVSAIRVGGGKRLKALIGRARESHSVAEQELLSSTSQNVCEMWSGQQIVRLIGNSDGMETLIITGDEQSADRLAKAWLGVAAKVAPNLALNVHNATAPAWELRAWAFFGTLLQIFSMGFAGVATHYLQWIKAEDQAAAYGYPCFCAGTVCLMLAIVACGHVIEGVTDEFTLSLTDDARRNGVRILSLQRARVVGDQHFPPCAILMAQHNGVFRSSRLNNKNYRWIAAISTSMAIPGYIIQFIGLRALHWSATLVQLGVTLVMTAIRAWVRRGLASDPAWCPLFEGHESATLALLTHSSKSAMFNQAKARHGMKRLFAKMNNASTNKIGQPLNELILGYFIDPGRSALMRSLDGFDQKLFLFPAGRPLQVCLQFSMKSLGEEKPDPLRIYARISEQTPPSRIDDEVETVSGNFSKVIESVMNMLDPLKTALLWRKGTAGHSLDPKVATCLSWEFDFCTSLLEDHEKLAKQELFFRLQKSTSRTGGHWRLLDRNLVSGLLALSFHGMAMRLEHLNQVWGRRNLSIGQNDLFLLPWNEGRLRRDFHPFNSGRIVGHGTSNNTSQKLETLTEWLDIGEKSLSISRIVPSQNEGGRPTREVDIEISMDTSPPMQCFLGMFLSSASRELSPGGYGQRMEELVIDTRDNSGMLLQWAQEMFSLFILAIASATEQVLGDTRELEVRDRPRFENSVFAKIADEAIKGGLVHDRAEAYTLIIPAFAHYGLLPTCNNEQEAENTSEKPTSPAPPNNEENTL